MHQCAKWKARNEPRNQTGDTGLGSPDAEELARVVTNTDPEPNPLTTIYHLRDPWAKC